MRTKHAGSWLSMGITFTFKKQGVVNVTMRRGMSRLLDVLVGEDSFHFQEPRYRQHDYVVRDAGEC